MEPLVAWRPSESDDSAEIRPRIRLLNEHVIAIEAKLLALQLQLALGLSREAFLAQHPKDRE